MGQPNDNDQPNDNMVRVYPKGNCPRCCGRGYIGESMGKRVECSCLTRKKAHVEPEQKKWGAQ